MSKYTIKLRELLEDSYYNEKIKQAMLSYKMYVAVNLQKYALIPTREELNEKILNHYKDYEIGQETPALFVEYLESTLNEIMPYYYSLYKSVDMINEIDDIFGNVDMTESFEETRSGNTNDTSSSSHSTSSSATSTTTTQDNTSGRSVKDDTPQSRINVTSIDDVTSASEINYNDNTSNSSATNTGTDNTSGESNGSTSSESTGEVKHTLHRKGNQGINTYAHDMIEFRELFNNIEKQIIDDLRDLFMLVW